MSDLIDRQAAIEALRRAEALTRAFGYHNVIDTIRELPSVQPQSKREWYQKGYEAGQKSVQPRWIPVTEALPDRYIVGGDGKHYSQDVLMTVIHRDDDIFIDYGQMVDDEWYSEMDKEIITSPFEVVAWMPLPEPYAERRQE